MKRDILKIFAAVDKSERVRCGVRIGLIAEAEERVGLPFGNVVIAHGDGAEDVVDGVFDEAGDLRGSTSVVEVEEERIEKGRRGAHDVADIVGAGDAGLVVRDGAIGEVTAGKLEGRKTVQGRIPGAKFPGIELKDGGVGGDEDFAGVALVGDKDGQRYGARGEIVLLRDRGEGVVEAALVGVDELVGERAAPVVGDGDVEVERRILFAADGVLDLGEVGDDVGVRGARKDVILELPDVAYLAVDDVLDASEVVAEETPDEPGTA